MSDHDFSSGPLPGPHHVLGSTALEVTRLGLGTVELGMAYGIGLPSPPDEDRCVDLLHRAFDLGIGFLDTAAAYGRSEELVGKAFGGRGHRPVIATKATTWDPETRRPLHGHALTTHLEASITRSLRVLRTDSLDLLQFHNIEPEQMTDDLFAFMDRLVGRGWIRYWGASTYGAEAPAAVIRHASHFASLQLAYNMLDKGLAASTLPAAADRGLGIVVRSVFLKGVLSPRYRELPEHLVGLRRAAAQMESIAAEAGLSLAEMALRFVLFSPFAHVVLFGTSRPDELQENARVAAAGPLPADLLERIDSVHVEDPALLNPATWGF